MTLSRTSFLTPHLLANQRGYVLRAHIQRTTAKHVRENAIASHYLYSIYRHIEQFCRSLARQTVRRTSWSQFALFCAALANLFSYFRRRFHPGLSTHRRIGAQTTARFLSARDELVSTDSDSIATVAQTTEVCFVPLVGIQDRLHAKPAEFSMQQIHTACLNGPRAIARGAGAIFQNHPVGSVFDTGGRLNTAARAARAFFDVLYATVSRRILALSGHNTPGPAIDFRFVFRNVLVFFHALIIDLLLILANPENPRGEYYGL